MARESCNLDKDEAEILKSSSPSSTSPPPPLPPSSSTSQPSIFLKTCEESPIELSERPEAPAVAAAAAEMPNAPASPPKPDEESKPEAATQTLIRFSNRCSTCQKKVGLTGFRCRCGDLFCGRHRYSDAHECSFDYKTAGREEIAKANPLIRAAKIIKI